MEGYSSQLEKSKIFFDYSKESFSTYENNRDENYLSICCINLYYSIGFNIHGILGLIEPGFAFKKNEKLAESIDLLLNSKIPNVFIEEASPLLNRLKTLIERSNWLDGLFDDRNHNPA